MLILPDEELKSVAVKLAAPFVEPSAAALLIVTTPAVLTSGEVKVNELAPPAAGEYFVPSHVNTYPVVGTVVRSNTASLTFRIVLSEFPIAI